MIEHTVTFRLRYDSDSPEARVFFNAASELSSISGVLDFSIRRQTSPKHNHTFGISMKFASSNDYKAYTEHPDHAAFIRDFWMKDVHDFQEADFEPLENLAG